MAKRTKNTADGKAIADAQARADARRQREAAAAVPSPTDANGEPAKGSKWDDGKQRHVVSTIATDHAGQRVVVYTGDDGQTRTVPVGQFKKVVGAKAV
jgi:hypothetical protein